MVRAVFFDFYNTLVQFTPQLDEIQQSSCRELGLTVAKRGIRRGYSAADEFMNDENAIKHLSDRTEEERKQFFIEYERMVLRGAGLEVSSRLAEQVWEMAIEVPKQFDLFDDVEPALELLKARGVIMGVISNLRQDRDQVSKELGLDKYLSFWVTSEEVKATKPHAPIFRAAIEKSGVPPGESVHVGDQYKSDVLGARAAGIIPVLLDRDGWHPGVGDCARIEKLPELDELLNGELSA
jgi:putative hydrolase of the HAD superfamily